MQKVFILLFLFVSFHSDAQHLYGLDPTFATNGIYMGDTGGVTKMAVQLDGKILIVGGGIKNGTYPNAMRFNSDGTIDNSFASNGYFFSPIVNSMGYVVINNIVLQPDGKIILGGALDTGSTNDDFFIMRLHNDGSLDNSFGGGGYIITDIGGDESITSMALQSDTKIVAAGGGQGYIAATRYHPDGTIDSIFGSNGVIVPDNQALGIHNPTVNGIAVMPDDRIVLGLGVAVVALNAYTFAAVRLLPDGDIDTSFNHGGVAFSGIVQGWLVYCKAMCLQPDGQVLLAGYSDSLAVIRFDTSGQLDNSFGSNGIVKLDPAGKVRDMLLQPDGKIVVATDPDAATISYDSCYTIYRIMPDGKTDTGFGNKGRLLTRITNESNIITCLALQSDSKLLAGSISWPRWTRGRHVMLARYTSDSSVYTPLLNVLDNYITTYPNPATDYLYFDIPTSASLLSAHLYSFDGKLLLTQTHPHTNRLSTAGLANGIYYLKLTLSNHQQVTKKILIQKQ